MFYYHKLLLAAVWAARLGIDRDSPNPYLRLYFLQILFNIDLWSFN